MMLRLEGSKLLNPRWVNVAQPEISDPLGLNLQYAPRCPSLFVATALRCGKAVDVHTTVGYSLKIGQILSD